MKPTSATIDGNFRHDLPGRFNEFDFFRRQGDRYFDSLDGTVLPPYEVLVHPSSGCNLRCDWCIGDHVPVELWDDTADDWRLLDASKSAERLPDALAVPDNMMKLARDICDYVVRVPTGPSAAAGYREYSVENISFSGLIGEPLVAARALLPALAFLAERGKRVGLFSNAVLLDAAARDQVSRIAYINVSLDAARAETYARLKFRGHRAGLRKFDSAVANVESLTQLRKRSDLPLEVNISFIAYPGNFHELYDAAQLTKKLGADSLRIKRDISGDRILDEQQRSEAHALVERARRDFEDENFRILSIHDVGEQPQLNRTFDSCRITDYMAAVGSDGHLYPCNYHPRPGGASYGSTLDESFRDIWEGATRARLRGELPTICPKVCDPFKTRANQLLAVADEVVRTDGVQDLREQIAQLTQTPRYELDYRRH